MTSTEKNASLESGDSVEGPVRTLRLCGALRESWSTREPGWLRADLLAGAVVGVVALPLSMALAISSGAPPEAGIYTAIVAGGLIAVLGGSRYQVSGPTAAFVVVLAPIAASYGLGGLAIATILAGLLLIGFGLLRMGRLIQLIPYPVTMGFTAGIAIGIAALQLESFLHLELDLVGDVHFHERIAAIVGELSTLRLSDTAIGLFALAVLAIWPRTKSRVPAALVALIASGLVAYFLSRFVDGFEIETLASRFGSPETPSGIARELPALRLPWAAAGGAGLTFGIVKELMPSAVAIAVLAAIESLLSAVIADGATGTQHDPDNELLALGIGNLVVPLFGGIAATGALARTATNIRSGARSPLAAIFHAGFVAAAIFFFAPVLGHLPMSSLAALLLIVAWNMSEARHVLRALREAPRSDALVLVVCLLLTVAFDMTVAVSVGLVLAAVLFMRRMIEISSVRLVSAGHSEEHAHLPPGVYVYEIAGPLFFGAAHRATSALRRISPDARVLVIDLSQVPSIDATGLFNLRSAVDRLTSRGVHIVLGGVRGQSLAALRRARVHEWPGAVQVHATIEEALAASAEVER